MPTAHLNGIDVYFERDGEGPRTLFCNGSGATLATAAPLIGPFRRALDLVAHDQRGLGRTEVPPGPFTMADYAADALALLDHLDWDTCRLVGVSFGGMVAQEIAVTAPERIERLALCCTSPGGAGGASYPLHELVDLSPEDRAPIAVRNLDSRFTPEFLADHPLERSIVEMMTSAPPADPPAEQRRGEVEQLQARRHHDVWDRLERITCPTLVAAGRYDGTAPLANSEAIASRIAGAELRVYEGGHLFFLQDGAALPDVVGFLAAAD